jgi:hypothetical protein
MYGEKKPLSGGRADRRKMAQAKARGQVTR